MFLYNDFLKFGRVYFVIYGRKTEKEKKRKKENDREREKVENVRPMNVEVFSGDREGGRCSHSGDGVTLFYLNMKR